MEETQVVEYDVTEAAISEMKSIYMDLTIKDITDKAEFSAVHDARMVVKGKRVAVEKQRKSLKSGALAYGKKVDSEAKRITGLLAPIEDHLDKEERKVTDEQKRIKAEEEAKEKAKIQERIDTLQKYDCVMSFFDVAGMTDDEFQAKLDSVIHDWSAEFARKKEEERLEKERKAKEEADRKAEDERLAKQKAEQEKVAAEQAEKEAALKAQQDAIDAEKREQERIAFEKQATEIARIKAEKDAKEKAKREAEEKAEAEWKAKEQAARREALKPDKVKLIAWANNFSDKNIPTPKFEHDEAFQILSYALGEIEIILQGVVKQAEKL